VESSHNQNFAAPGRDFSTAPEVVPVQLRMMRAYLP
jgi:hypothetical protein